LINLLVVEDSPSVREFLVQILGSDPDIRIIGTANNGEEAIDAVRRCQPDVITMDIHMPKMDGLEATRRIMETHPKPIIIVSGSWDPREVATTFEAMEAGALAVQGRPTGVGHPDHETTARALLQTVKLMAEVKVVRRWPRARADALASRPATRGPAREPAQVSIVAVGASTGGPPALQTLLTTLPKDFPAPVLIVQHMTAGFVGGFVEWLAKSSNLPVHVATHGRSIVSGHVYIAPDDVQMEVDRRGKIVLSCHAAENGLRPSVSCLFRSIAEVYGRGAVACLLTGMGRDGAAELRILKERGAVTFAQDKDSSVVHGMPGEAIKLDAAMFVLPPHKIAAVLARLARQREGV
jgi:two-component system chemotaxis response regulator CheB